MKAAACADCHTPHRNLAASDPRSSVHPDNLAKTCGACHKNANASFLTFDPHANPSDPTRNPYVYWLWLGMTSLLVGVFGFFGLHGLLWMQRALVGKLRGEFTFSHGGDGPYVRRFSGMQMGVHISIVLSFLLLGRHRPAAEVRRSALGARPDDAAGRRRVGGLPAPPGRHRDLRLLRLAPRHAGATTCW